MKKVINLFLIYILPPLLVLIYFEFNLPRVKTTYNEKRMFLESKISEYEVLVVGSSHMNQGVNPGLFDFDGINMAGVSQSIYYDYHLVSKYIGQMKNLKVVLIGLDYFSLEFNLCKGPEYWRCFFYEKEYSIRPECNDHDLDIKRFSWTYLIGRNESFVAAKNNFDSHLDKNILKNGTVFQECLDNPDSTINNQAGKERVDQHHNIFMDERNLLVNVLNLKKMIKLIKSRGVIPVIVVPPVFHTYYDNVNQKKYEQFDGSIKDISAEYDIKYFNYFRDERFLIEDFSDNDHLCIVGMEKFSKIINDEILKPFLR